MQKITASSGNVFADMGFDNEEAANLQMRSRLMAELKTVIEQSGMTQKQAAELLGVHQSRISDLTRGKIDRFSVDILVNWLARIGRRVTVHVEKIAA